MCLGEFGIDGAALHRFHNHLGQVNGITHGGGELWARLDVHSLQAYAADDGGTQHDESRSLLIVSFLIVHENMICETMAKVNPGSLLDHRGHREHRGMGNEESAQFLTRTHMCADLEGLFSCGLLAGVASIPVPVACELADTLGQVARNLGGNLQP